MNSTKLIRSALSGVITLGAIAASGSAVAAEGDGMEKCAGVIKAGKNDCATSMNACHGHVHVDAHPEAWIFVPIGTCQKIVGAHITTAANTTPPNERQTARKGPR